MDEIMYFDQSTAADMKVVLLMLQQQYGQLQLFSSRAFTEISRSIDEILKVVISFLKNRLKMYNIKIFSDFEKRPTYLPTFATCYNYLLLNTNFSSQYLLRKDTVFGHIVGIWPTLSSYLFIQIIWYSKCEDLMIESLMHIPMDLCVNILELTIKHIDELAIRRARRLIFLLIYKVYNKLLWLHFDTVSEQNVTKLIGNVHQLIICFEIMSNLLISPKFITSRNLSIERKYRQHGILVKNILQCIKKCMHSKTKSYSEHYNLTRFFRLTYGNFNENTNYHQIFPTKEIQSIIIRLDHKLATLLLNQIKYITSSEYMVWKNIHDDENTMISIHRAIIIECHYLREFMKENDFLVKHEQTFLCLKRLIGPRKSEEYALTLQELCHDIAKGQLHGIKELIKRYKEWNLSTLNFIRHRIKLLRLNDFYIILEYLYYKFTYLHTKAEKYQVYVSVLKILIHLKVQDMHFIILKYMKRHFDDNYLEDLYNEKSFDAFLRRNLLVEKFNDSRSIMNVIAQRCCSLLIFILLNPKTVLSKLIFYEIEISTESSDSILFQHNMFAFLQKYYSLRKDQCNVLLYILKNIVLQQRMAFPNFRTFMTKVLDYQMITADDVINELYIPYLISSYVEEINTDTILSHIRNIVQKMLCTRKTKLVVLIILLIKKASLFRRFNLTFSKFQICKWMEFINDILECLYSPNVLTKTEYDMLRIIFLDYYHVEPLDMKKIRPEMNALEIIWEYEKRYLVVYRRLRTNRCSHPKLRNYVEFFNLDREAFIRHIMLHCFETEYVIFMCDLTFIFWYHLGWTDEMMAYENIMRITVDVSQVALMYLDRFPKDTFVMLLFATVQFSWCVAKKLTHDKYDAIRSILLNTLLSMSHMANKTHYGDLYDRLLECIADIDPYIKKQDYFEKIRHWITIFLKKCESLVPQLYEDCTCDDSSYCKHYILLIDDKVATMYDTYLFIRECNKLFNTETHRYSEYLLNKFDLTE